MKYRTNNELEHFQFQDAYIGEIEAMNGRFSMTINQVTILPENSCNRDIRLMRTNDLILRITDGAVTSFIEEGYKVYDANGNLQRQQEDETIAPADYSKRLVELHDCALYSIEKKENDYLFSIDGEYHTFLLTVTGTGDLEEWDRFFNLEMY